MLLMQKYILSESVLGLNYMYRDIHMLFTAPFAQRCIKHLSIPYIYFKRGYFGLGYTHNSFVQYFVLFIC
jgi:hypothetical protein